MRVASVPDTIKRVPNGQRRTSGTRFSSISAHRLGETTRHVISAEDERTYESQNRRKRRGRDSNPRWSYPHSGFQDRCNRPLCHLSGGWFLPGLWCWRSQARAGYETSGDRGCRPLHAGPDSLLKKRERHSPDGEVARLLWRDREPGPFFNGLPGELTRERRCGFGSAGFGLKATHRLPLPDSCPPWPLAFLTAGA